MKAYTSALIGCIATAVMVTSAQADFQAMSRRLPASSNVIVAVNVAKMLSSPYGQQHQWAENQAEKWQTRPLLVPPGVKQLLMGADLDPKTIDVTWQVCLMEMLQMPSLDSLAQAHHGYLDRVWDKNAIVSPQNAYFIPLDEKTLASITPASRQAIAKWVREPVKPDGNVTSAYIKTVALGLNDDTDVTMALDLEGAFAVPNVRRWLDNSEIPELSGKNLDGIAQMFGEIKGLVLNVKVGDDITAQATAQFDRDTAVLAPVAKPLMIGILKHVGMRLADVDDWKFSGSGKTITMEGKLSEESLRMLLGLVQSPIPTSGASGTMANGNGNANTNATLDPAVASQRYYKFVCMILDGLSAKSSLSETSTWFKNAAKRIEQAPILNVDPDLVDWGAMVTTKLKEVSAVAAVGYTQTTASSAAAQTGVVDYGSYTYDANGEFHSKIGAEAEANRQQRRQAAAQQKAASQQQGLQILNEIPASRAKIRAEMTQKYKIEF